MLFVIAFSQTALYFFMHLQLKLSNCPFLRLWLLLPAGHLNAW